METQRTLGHQAATNRPPHLAVRIALVYALFGTLWILLSDRLLEALVRDPNQVAQWQTVKGWLFVVASTALIYWLLARADRRRQVVQEALEESEAFARAALDGLSAHIAIVDAEGTILAVNQAWRDFASDNPPLSANVCEGANYLDVCGLPGNGAGDEASSFAAAIRSVLGGRAEAVAIEYPCHSPSEERWFVGRITRFPGDGPPRAVVAHENVTPQKVLENSIRQSEVRFRHISAAISDIAYSCHSVEATAFRLDWVTGAVEQMTGYTVDELVTAGCWRSLVVPDDLPLFDRMVTGLAAGSSATCEIRLQHKGGNTIWVTSSAECVTEPGEAPVRRIYGALVDITQRRADEELMRLQAAALQAAANGIAITDREGTIEWVNPAFTSLTGYSFEESIGHNPRDLVRSGRHRSAFYRDLWDTILAGKVWRGEMINRRKDGEIYHEDQTITPVMDAAGEVSHFVAIKQDITEHRNAEGERERLLHRMQMQADQMTQIMRCVPAGVVLLDRKGVILLANPQAAGDLALLAPVTTGAPLATLGGRPLADFFTSPPTGKWHVVSWENRTFEVIARPVEGGPIPAGWVLVLRDVTEERVVQEQLQRQERLAAIGQLAAGIAHDFNNIMSVISIYAEMTAQAQGLTEHERARVASIDQQASRATRMIRQILDFSRRSVLERQAMDLLPLMQEQQKLLQQTLPESIAIRLVHEPGEYIIKGDPTRFQQLVMNLAFNARDAMPDGGLLSFVLGHLHVSSDLDAPLAAMKPGGWIRIAVQDTGAGMSPEILQHVFEPFFTTKPPGQGTGLGLAQVHGIVAQHDGHIAVESQVGMGTTFTVYVPAMVVVTPGEAAQYVMASTRRGNGERLLVVEDDAALRATLVELLGLWNYRATAVCDGEEALALLADNHGQVDLILSDVVMPRLGGIGLVKMLRNRAVTTPVILLTGHAMGQELEGLAALGLSAWLAKPPSAEQLASAIAAALHKGHAKGQP